MLKCFATKTEILKTLYLAIVLLLVLNGTSQAGRLLPMYDNWGRNFRYIAAQKSQDDFIMNQVNIPYRYVRVEYLHNAPFEIVNESNYQSYKESGTSVDVLFPFYWNSQRLFIKFDNYTRDSKLHLNSDHHNSYFYLNDDYSHNAILFAHRWEKIRIKWAFQLRFAQFGSTNYVEPVYGVEWGEEATAKFILEIGKYNLHNNMSWHLDSDSISATLLTKVETARLSLKFGSPRGLSSLLTIEDEYFNPNKNNTLNNYTMQFTGVKRKIGIDFIYHTEQKLDWSMGFAMNSTEGDLVIDYLGQREANLPRLSQAINSVHGEISYVFSPGWALRTGGSFFSSSLDTDVGESKTDLPESFLNVISNEHLYQFAISGKGNLSYVNFQRVHRSFGFKIETGYAAISPRARVLDQSKHGTDFVRITDWDLKSFGAVWGSAEIETQILGWTTGVSVSQLKPVWVKYTSGSPSKLGEFNNGEILKLRLSYKF